MWKIMTAVGVNGAGVNQLDYSSGRVHRYRSHGGRSDHVTCELVTSGEWGAVHWFSDRQGLCDTV